MASQKDVMLLAQLIEATKQGRVSWQPTANFDEFTTSFRGRFSVVVSRSRDGFLLRMFDESDREMVRLDEDAYWLETLLGANERVELHELFELARRSALNVDQAIDDVLHELRG